MTPADALCTLFSVQAFGTGRASCQRGRARTTPSAREGSEATGGTSRQASVPVAAARGG